MESLVAALLVLNGLLVLTLSSLLLLLRGNIRTLERERNVHNQQVSELLDRVAHAGGKPWTLPPRPVEPVSEETELIDYVWREV